MLLHVRGQRIGCSSKSSIEFASGWGAEPRFVFHHHFSWVLSMSHMESADCRCSDCRTRSAVLSLTLGSWRVAYERVVRQIRSWAGWHSHGVAIWMGFVPIGFAGLLCRLDGCGVLMGEVLSPIFTECIFHSPL